jgi:hypothetical protein
MAGIHVVALNNIMQRERQLHPCIRSQEYHLLESVLGVYYMYYICKKRPVRGNGPKAGTINWLPYEMRCEYGVIFKFPVCFAALSCYSSSILRL